MSPDAALFFVEFVFWCGLVLAAPVMTAWAFLRTTRRHVPATVALCLWCAVAGGVLMGSMWSWMHTENRQFQLRKIQALPKTAVPADVNLRPMEAIIFFVGMDGVAKRLAYLTAIVPLVGTAILVRKNLSEKSPPNLKSVDPDDDLFTPYSP
jgi:hypothetical protein